MKLLLIMAIGTVLLIGAVLFIPSKIEKSTDLRRKYVIDHQCQFDSRVPSSSSLNSKGEVVVEVGADLYKCNGIDSEVVVNDEEK